MVSINQGNRHTGGYEQTYREIGEILGTSPGDNVSAVIFVLMETLAGKLTQEEFYELAMLLERTGTRIRDKDGNVHIDIWGEFNSAINSGDTYGWPEGVRNGC